MTSSASRAEPGVREPNSVGDERLILKPNRSCRVAIQRMRVASRASCVVGFAGCDSVESSDVVNRLLVADRRGSFTPGYAWLAKRACAHPGLLPVASFAARRGETTELFLVDACVLTRDVRFWCQASIVSAMNALAEILFPKCREAASGRSPGWSDDVSASGSESSAVRRPILRTR